MAEQAVLAHDVGVSADLPIPLSFALVGAAWVVASTFAVVAFAWRQPRFDPARPGRPLPEWVTRAVDSPISRLAAAGVALSFTVWVVVAAVFGPQDGENPLRGVFYALLWVGLLVVSVAIGPVWRVISPVRTLHRLITVGRGGANGDKAHLARWGYWPAAVGLFAFVWLELASPNLGTLTAIKFWLVGYVVAMMAGAVVAGDRWFARADPFEVYSVVASRLSPFRRSADTGRIIVGNPLDHLPSMPVRPGTLAVLAVLLGSTAFDSFSARPQIENFVYDHAAALPLVSDVVGGTLLRTFGLAVFIAGVAVTFSAAARATGGVDRLQRNRLPGQMAHSLIPIIVGYMLAHYLSYLIEKGQETVILLADPLDRGWELFGLTIGDANHWLSLHPAVWSTIQVSCVVAGHVIAVVAAHDKALGLLPVGHRVTGQLALMLTMVGYSFIGLYLLFAG
jgi:hypothetical protein